MPRLSLNDPSTVARELMDERLTLPAAAVAMTVGLARLRRGLASAASSADLDALAAQARAWVEAADVLPAIIWDLAAQALNEDDTASFDPGVLLADLSDAIAAARVEMASRPGALH